MLFISIIFALSLAIGVSALYAPNVHIWLSKQIRKRAREKQSRRAKKAEEKIPALTTNHLIQP